MTRPRAHLVDPTNRGVYHVISRCVRRAWLCGNDPVTGRSFDHRRQWIEDRLHFLGKRFAVAIHGYAVMSNHYHVVIELDPSEPSRWNDLTVAHRWLELYPPRRCLDDSVPLEADAPEVQAILLDRHRLALIRQRLGSLSWFMKLVNEPLARLANREDACTGRFWEGRFKSHALLGEAAWVAATVYVDLNPVRAHISNDPEQGPHTSIRHRIDQLSAEALGNVHGLPPVATSLRRPCELPLSLDAYRQLLAHAVTQDRMPTEDVRTALRRLEVDPVDWIAMVSDSGRRGRAVFGRLHHLVDYINKTGQRWVKGIRSAA